MFGRVKHARDGLFSTYWRKYIFNEYPQYSTFWLHSIYLKLKAGLNLMLFCLNQFIKCHNNLVGKEKLKLFRIYSFIWLLFIKLLHPYLWNLKESSRALYQWGYSSEQLMQ